MGTAHTSGGVELPSVGSTRQGEAFLRQLRSFLHASTGTHSAEQIAEWVTEYAVKQDDVTSAEVLLRDGDVLRRVAGHGGPLGSRGCCAEPVGAEPVGADRPAAEVARTGVDVRADDLADLTARFPELGPAAPYPAHDTLHFAPLRVDTTVIGVLVLTFAPAEMDGESERGLVAAMADLLAEAVAHSRVTARLEDQRRREHALLTAQADALAAVISGESLSDVLDTLLRAVEAASPEQVLASVLLLSEDGHRLLHASAPSLPSDYNAAIDGVEIGPSVGSCGTAAHRRTRVVVSDIAVDPLWADFRELAARAGLRACWSTPIIGSAGDLLGTFALYYRAPRHPDPADLAAIDVLAGTVALLVDRSRGAALGLRLQDEAARRLGLELAVEAGGVGTFDWDLESGVLAWDEQLLDIFGVEDRDRDLTIDDFFASVHPGDVERVRAQLGRSVAEQTDFDSEYRVVLPDGRHRWVAARGRILTDLTGESARLIGAAQDTTEARDTRTRVARIMDSLSTGFCFLDPSWRFTFLNGEAERVLGRSREELLNKSIWAEFPAAIGSEFETNYRLAAATGEPVAFDAYYPEPLNAWYEVRAWPSPDGLAVYFLDVTERRAAQQAAQRAIGRAGLIARVSEELAGTLDRTDSMRRLAGIVVPTLADWCVVTLVQDDRHAGTRRGLGEAIGWHADPALRALADEYAQTRLERMTDHALVSRAVETAELQLLNGDARSAVGAMFDEGSRPLEILHELDIHSAVVLPLAGQEQPVGMLSVVNTSRRGEFGEEDLALLREIAARAGLVLDRARLYRQQRAVAETLQRSLLRPPQTRHDVRMSVAYVPAAEVAQVGGDWYDAFNQPDGSSTLIIGDVMGHDLPAAAAMGEARTLLRSLAAQDGGDPARTLDDAERVMQQLDVDTLATVFVGRIGAGGPGATCLELTYSVAGHPPPLVVRADGSVEEIGRETVDPLLGIGHAGRGRHRCTLEDGASLVLYTDGLVERRDQPVDEGIALLRRTLEQLDTRDPDRVRDAVLARMLPERSEDDVALLVVRVELDGAG